MVKVCMSSYHFKTSSLIETEMYPSAHIGLKNKKVTRQKNDVKKTQKTKKQNTITRSPSDLTCSVNHSQKRWDVYERDDLCLQRSYDNMQLHDWGLKHCHTR